MKISSCIVSLGIRTSFASLVSKHVINLAPLKYEFLLCDNIVKMISC